MKLRAVIPQIWRDVLARAPLPMLALAASYGVYRFAALFVPEWVAVVQAAAFELVYIGLAVVRLDAPQQRRARAISIGAVLVSMVYNSLDGLFHRREDLLVSPPLWLDVSLSLLHGIPLALLAYLVADLLLHSSSAHSPASAQNGSSRPKSEASPADAIKGGRPADFSLQDLLLALDGEISFNRDLVVDRLRCSDATVTRLLAEGMQSGQLVRESRGLYRLAGVV